MHILGNIPSGQKFYVACSGGADSMVLVDFLRRYPKNAFELCFFNHGTSSDNEAELFLSNFCQKNLMILNVGRITRDKNKGESLEEYWRNERYNYLSKFSDGNILTAHHLDDVVETWLFSSIRGFPKLIPYKRDNIIRPLLLTSKKEIMEWATKNNIEFVNDNDNSNMNLDRNYIRNVMMPHVLRINKGIHKVIKKKIIEEFNRLFK